MPRQLLERGRLLEATGTTDSGAVRRQIQIITPGWGTSGYYSAEVLERAAEERVIPAGTHMYFNHASESERHDRPERDVRDIAAVLAEDARWDGTRLFGEADIMAPHAELIEALAPYIGVSISGSATDIVEGEAEGRRGPIIEGLAAVNSVDFVTHAGREGRVLEVLESARPSLVVERAVARGVTEATANETREQLSDAVRAAYGSGEDTWVWVRDFDDNVVWFEVDNDEGSTTFEQAYELDSRGNTNLSGDRTEVRPETRYVPVNDPAGQPNNTEESEEDTMPQIEEARLRELEEAAGRVQTLESERDTARRERDEAREELVDNRRNNRAREVLTEAADAASVRFSPLEQRGLLADLPATEDGSLDEEAFRTTVKETAAQAFEASGAGNPRGLGHTASDGDGEVTEANVTRSVAAAFGRTITEEA